MGGLGVNTEEIPHLETVIPSTIINRTKIMLLSIGGFFLPKLISVLKVLIISEKD